MRRLALSLKENRKIDIQEIQDRFIANNWTLSLAESCTGGSLAAAITKIPGSSRYFLGSIVAYSNFLKTQLLGIEPKFLEDYGAVSSQVVQKMAEEVLRLSGSDFSIAISGIAGPDGGTPSKPVGTIWAAIARKGGETLVWNFHLTGSRIEIIDQCVEIVLSKLNEHLLEC